LRHAVGARAGHRPGDPGLRTSDVVAGYQRAPAIGDVDAIVALLEPDGYARESARGR
jgi:hypothetical protein